MRERGKPVFSEPAHGWRWPRASPPPSPRGHRSPEPGSVNQPRPPSPNEHSSTTVPSPLAPLQQLERGRNPALPAPRGHRLEKLVSLYHLEIVGPDTRFAPARRRPGTVRIRSCVRTPTTGRPPVDGPRLHLVGADHQSGPYLRPEPVGNHPVSSAVNRPHPSHSDNADAYRSHARTPDRYCVSWRESMAGTKEIVGAKLRPCGVAVRPPIGSGRCWPPARLCGRAPAGRRHCFPLPPPLPETRRSGNPGCCRCRTPSGTHPRR